MKFYHGTETISGKNILGPPANVKICVGGGELGQGFYLGENMSLAITWAKGRYLSPQVLEFTVNNSDYAQLTLKQLRSSQVTRIWNQLKRLGTQKTYVFGVDVVFGPLATMAFACQYKFESMSAEGLLNKSKIKKIL
jgi:hypothetical protein